MNEFNCHFKNNYYFIENMTYSSETKKYNNYL